MCFCLYKNIACVSILRGFLHQNAVTLCIYVKRNYILYVLAEVACCWTQTLSYPVDPVWSLIDSDVCLGEQAQRSEGNAQRAINGCSQADSPPIVVG